MLVVARALARHGLSRCHWQVVPGTLRLGWVFAGSFNFPCRPRSGPAAWCWQLPLALQRNCQLLQSLVPLGETALTSIKNKPKRHTTQAPPSGGPRAEPVPLAEALNAAFSALVRRFGETSSSFCGTASGLGPLQHSGTAAPRAAPCAGPGRGTT